MMGKQRLYSREEGRGDVGGTVSGPTGENVRVNLNCIKIGQVERKGQVLSL